MLHFYVKARDSLEKVFMNFVLAKKALCSPLPNKIKYYINLFNNGVTRIS
jgi:hypothetical protein